MTVHQKIDELAHATAIAGQPFIRAAIEAAVVTTFELAALSCIEQVEGYRQQGNDAAADALADSSRRFRVMAALVREGRARDLRL